MTKQALLNGLEAYVQEEIGARRRMLAIVDAQERAILAGKSADLELATRDIEAEIERDTERSARRARLFAAAATTWRVAPAALSLSSIAERFGPAAERLCTLRTELRSATAELARRNRRLSVLVSTHRRLLAELIQTLLASEDAAPLAVSGTLIDAEV
ncbi:MAG: flagellar export chaperone FlgN [Planctomycetota bacterium]